MSPRVNWERGFRRITWVVSAMLVILAVSLQLDLNPSPRTRTPGLLLDFLDDFALLVTETLHRVWPAAPIAIDYVTLVLTVATLPWAVFLLLRWMAWGFSAERPV